jgi:hypothetical protein
MKPPDLTGIGTTSLRTALDTPNGRGALAVVSAKLIKTDSLPPFLN